MLYECYRCGNLTDEEDGVITHKQGILFIVSNIFISKSCLRKEGENTKKQRENKKLEKFYLGL